MPESEWMSLYRRALDEVAQSFEELMKTWKARQQTIGRRLEGSGFAEVSAVTQGIDYAGERIPHNVDSMLGAVGVDRILSVVRDHIAYLRRTEAATDLDRLARILEPQQHGADAPYWAFVEARAISQRSIVPPVWHEQLLDLEKEAGREPTPELRAEAEREAESRRRRFLSFAKKQE